MLDNDIAGALIIEQQSSGHPWTNTMFADELLQTDSRFYVVATDEQRQEVVGFCGLMLALDEGHITNIAVDPGQRRSGVASQLLLHVTRVAIARSIRSMTLEVRVGNEPAKAMYARFGYVPVGARPKYYADTGEDALIYWAHDVDTAAYGLRLAQIAERLQIKRTELLR